MVDALKGNSPTIQSNQKGVHERLTEIVNRHRAHPYLKPIAEHSKATFSLIAQQIARQPDRKIVLDTGCGTGQSSFRLATRYPDCWVIGIDQSSHRLTKSGWRDSVLQQKNVILARADLVDFWRLAGSSGWRLERHYFLYPNPWPKSEHLKRRWHAHPVFPEALVLGGLIELRTNWRVYAEEFQQALKLVSARNVEFCEWTVTDTLTPFETKYTDSGHQLYRVLCDLR